MWPPMWSANSHEVLACVRVWIERELGKGIGGWGRTVVPHVDDSDVSGWLWGGED